MLPILSQCMNFAHQIKTNNSNYVLSRKEVAEIKIKTKCFAVTDGIERRCTFNSCSSSDILWTVNNNCVVSRLYSLRSTFHLLSCSCKVSPQQSISKQPASACMMVSCVRPSSGFLVPIVGWWQWHGIRHGDTMVIHSPHLTRDLGHL